MNYFNLIKFSQNIHNLVQLDPERQGGAYFNIGHYKAFPHRYKPEDIVNIQEYVYLWTQNNGLTLNKVQTGQQIHQNLFQDFFNKLDKQQAHDIQNKMCFVFGRIDNKDGWRASTKRANICRSNWSDTALSKFRKDLASRFPNIKIYT